MGRKKPVNARWQFCYDTKHDLHLFRAKGELLGFPMPRFIISNNKFFDSLMHPCFVINQEAARIAIAMNSRVGYNPEVPMVEYEDALSAIANRMLSELLTNMIKPKKLLSDDSTCKLP